jgi:MFS family permease
MSPRGLGNAIPRWVFPNAATGGRENDLPRRHARAPGATSGKRGAYRGCDIAGRRFGLSTLITPLYVIYQQEFGFSQITLTLIYAAYVIGNITALLFFGRLSDHIGRRPTAIASNALLIVATLVFLFAKGVATLYTARVVSGFAIGIASGTANAWLAELVGTSP